jgi:hypothetical protein
VLDPSVGHNSPLRGVVSCVCFAGRRAARCRGAARDRASLYIVAHFVRPLAVACGPSARLSRERRVPIGRHWPVARDGPRWANWRTISDGPGEVASGPGRAVLVSAAAAVCRQVPLVKVKLREDTAHPATVEYVQMTQRTVTALRSAQTKPSQAQSPRFCAASHRVASRQPRLFRLFRA